MKIVVMASLGAVLLAHEGMAQPPAAPIPSSAPASAGPARPDAPILHVVLFTLGPGADAAALAADCRRLLKGIPGVDEVQVGAKAVDDRDVHVKDYDVGLQVRLHRLGDLPAYLAHPRHRELVEAWRPKARWRVIDFYAE